jgi:hypothetical protein
VCEHGGSLTVLGRLILEERLQMKARTTAENVRMIVSEDRRLL